MREKPWIERTFGPSWSTTVTGLGGVPIALIVVWVGILYESKELLGFGVTIFGIALAALGVLARSNSASESAHDESLRLVEENRRHIEGVAREGEAKHIENVQAIAAVEDVAAETARTVAAETTDQVIARRLNESGRPR